MRFSSRKLLVFYDSDCGFCHQTARIIRRLDIFNRITWAGREYQGERPAEVDQLSDETIVVWNKETDEILTHHIAFSVILSSLPMGFIVSWIFRVPGISHVSKWIYNLVANSRISISNFFGFTACPDVCPISLSTISNVFHNLKTKELEKSKALFITLDPERDKVEMMREYTGFFHQNIIGLTDEPRNISKVARLYGVNYRKKEFDRSALGYVINHTADIYLVDTDGMLIQRYQHDVDPEVLILKIRSIFQNQG